MMSKDLEILAPAGNLQSASVALQHGADAIYLGLPNFSARHSADNFTEDEFRAVVRKAHFYGAKVYVAMNTLVKDAELGDFVNSLLFAWNEGADAIILQDPMLGRAIHRQFPSIVLHLSTQAGVCNEDGARLAKSCGFSRVILARETPISEIEKITKILETEVFVQGALCTCFSGQCYFSSFVGGNSGNRGRCKQPCRKLYAYDRNGNTEKNYALSLSDLSVGEDVQKLIDAGVTSFKIEGRMRRAEYVGASVRYYRLILDKKDGKENALSDLRRTFNRGNYTKGLAFGQDKRFLSPSIQGHLGEKVGVVKVVNGKFFVESRFSPNQGDAFKILRDGKEVGGASFLKKEGKGFTLFTRQRLKNGDGVFITTDTAVNERLLSAEYKPSLSISLRFVEGEKPTATCGDFTFVGDEPLQSAIQRALTETELRACFEKTDGLPVKVTFDEITIVGGIFIPKSELNAFRRAFYDALSTRVAKGDRREISYQPLSCTFVSKPNTDKLTVIATDFTDITTDIAVCKADDLTKPLPSSFINGAFEKYVYYPPFATEKDFLAIETHCKENEVDGVYAENWGAVEFALTRGLRVFAGVGLNLFNRVSIAELLSLGVTYYTVSKETNAREAKNFTGDGAFVLHCGDVKIMELCYCPFGKTCTACDKKSRYVLTDENGREFPVRRYVAGDGSCRFEVYNCAKLIGENIQGAGKIIDLTMTENKKQVLSLLGDENLLKQAYKTYTSGHYKRGVE